MIYCAKHKSIKHWPCLYQTTKISEQNTAHFHNRGKGHFTIIIKKSNHQETNKNLKHL